VQCQFLLPNAGFYVQGGIPNQQQIRGNVPMQMRGGNLQRWNGGNVGYGAMPGYVQQQNFGHRGAARQQYQAQAGRQVGGRSQVQVPFGGRSQQPLPQVQSQFAPRQPPISQPPHHIRTEDLSSKLTSASPQEAKQLLGEHLYPLVAKLATTEQSGKLVGMLLEMDNSELLVLLDNPELLHNRVNEALSVLQQSKPSDI
jgi:polyadenylate-binding protein